LLTIADDCCLKTRMANSQGVFLAAEWVARDETGSPGGGADGGSGVLIVKLHVVPQRGLGDQALPSATEMR
jgi:hypothetical protein